MQDRIQFARADGLTALEELIDVVRVLPAEACAAPSALPDWTRGHVLAHVDGVTHALARQAEHAARGERIEPYDGGFAGRVAAIEAASTRTPAEHVAALEAARDRAAAAWPAPGSPVWDAPTAYRDGPVTGCVLAWWREMRIHAVDAAVGIGLDTWNPRLLNHLKQFLAERLPKGVVLSDDDVPSDDDAVPGPPPAGGESPPRAAPPDATWPEGPGAPAPSSSSTIISGAPTDVVAWLAGRRPDGPVRAVRDGAEVPLPELAPWPGAVTPTTR